MIHALIPARSGSKSIPKKNIRVYKGQPLLVHSIRTALKCPLIKKVVVSTDSEEIRDIAVQNGAEAPFLRSEDISGDLSLDIECFRDYILWLSSNNHDIPDIIVHLRPTYPERSEDLVTNCIKKFLEVKNIYTSLRSVSPVEKSPMKMYVIKDNVLLPLFKTFDGIIEPYNSVRQLLPRCYLHNGCIDILRSDIIIKKTGSMTGDKIYPYVMDSTEKNDIDTEDDWKNSLKRLVITNM